MNARANSTTIVIPLVISLLLGLFWVWAAASGEAVSDEINAATSDLGAENINVVAPQNLPQESSELFAPGSIAASSVTETTTPPQGEQETGQSLLGAVGGIFQDITEGVGAIAETVVEAVNSWAERGEPEVVVPETTVENYIVSDTGDSFGVEDFSILAWQAEFPIENVKVTFGDGVYTLVYDEEGPIFTAPDNIFLEVIILPARCLGLPEETKRNIFSQPPCGDATKFTLSEPGTYQFSAFEDSRMILGICPRDASCDEDSRFFKLGFISGHIFTRQDQPQVSAILTLENMMVRQAHHDVKSAKESVETASTSEQALISVDATASTTENSSRPSSSIESAEALTSEPTEVQQVQTSTASPTEQ